MLWELKGITFINCSIQYCSKSIYSLLICEIELILPASLCCWVSAFSWGKVWYWFPRAKWPHSVYKLPRVLCDNFGTQLQSREVSEVPIPHTQPYLSFSLAPSKVQEREGAVLDLQGRLTPRMAAQNTSMSEPRLNASDWSTDRKAVCMPYTPAIDRQGLEGLKQPVVGGCPSQNCRWKTTGKGSSSSGNLGSRDKTLGRC
jgi:hypothetical protein